MSFRILSIDGGGLRGVIPLEILKEIELRTGKPVASSFDLVAGTSTGGIIASAISLRKDASSAIPKFTLDQISSIYAEFGKEIFHSVGSVSILDHARAKWKEFFSGPKYSTRGLDKVLETFFGNSRLSDCIIPVFVPAFDLKLYRPLYFSSRFINPSSRGYWRGKNILLKDICRATSAAPTYFPSHAFDFLDETNKGYKPNCIDGGVFVNNPALAALAEVITTDSAGNTDPLYNKLTNIKDIYILSLGTGFTENSIIELKTNEMGKLKWIRPLIDLMMQANSGIVEQQAEVMLRANYLRINIPVSKEYAEMSDASVATNKYLTERVNSLIRNDITWLNTIQDFINRAGL